MFFGVAIFVIVSVLTQLTRVMIGTRTSELCHDYLIFNLPQKEDKGLEGLRTTLREGATGG